MAADMDFSPLYRLIEGGYNKDNVPAMEDQASENLNNIKQMTNGKPPRHLSVMRHSVSSIELLATADLSLDVGVTANSSPSEEKLAIYPFSDQEAVLKEDLNNTWKTNTSIDNLVEHLGNIGTTQFPSPGAFYGVFDGHGGIDVASFIRNNVLNYIADDSHFPTCLEESFKSAFLKDDFAFADASSLDVSSGTTALTALILGRIMIIANAGDCRVVMGRRGRAI